MVNGRLRQTTQLRRKLRLFTYRHFKYVYYHIKYTVCREMLTPGAGVCLSAYKRATCHHGRLSRLFEALVTMASSPLEDPDFVRVRWEGNNSKMYDGRTQDIPRKTIVSGAVAVGSTVIIVWGRQSKTSRLWTAVVVDLLDHPAPTPPPRAKRLRLLGKFLYSHVHVVRYFTTTCMCT